MTEKKLKIVKPEGGFLEKFKSKRAPTIAGVTTLLTALPVLRIADAGDFARLHPDEENYWSPELCFVTVPIHGEKRDLLHLIDEIIAMQYLPAKQIKRHRLALATKPHDVFFFSIVPSQNLEDSWNSTAITGCERAKTHWVKVTSRSEEGVKAYKITPAQDEDAFPPPQWPARSLEELIEVTFKSVTIETDDHPGLRRLIGAKQDLK